MASLNRASGGAMRTTNRSGHAAYRLDDRTRLLTMALTTMLGEPKHYGDNTDEMLGLAARLCDDGDGEWVAKLAVWVRTRGNLRSASHAIMAVVAHHCSGSAFVRPAARAIASVRGDDGTELLATHKALYGSEVRWPHALQRGVRDALEEASPHSLAKYQSRNRDMKLRDVLRITHPDATSARSTEAMGRVVDGTLPVPKSWETELSERGNTKEVWDELLREGRVGIMACVRNLRNMMRAGADVAPVIGMLRDPEVISRSRMLPFRFHSAYRELASCGCATTELTRALDAAMGLACANVEGLGGRTAVLIDKSGSMSYRVSRESTVTCADIAAVMGAMVAHVADDAWVCAFDSRARVVPMTGTSVLADAAMVPSCGGATYMDRGFDALIGSGFDADRVVVLSDCECNSAPNTRTMQSKLDEYRRKVGHDVWCHAIDLQGYGTTQFIGPKVNVMAGWSEQVLRFISLAELGFGSMVGEIDGVDL